MLIDNERDEDMDGAGEQIRMYGIEQETDAQLRLPLRLKILSRHSWLTKAQLDDMVRSLTAAISAEIGYLANQIKEEE